jgi:hypothetical protein
MLQAGTANILLRFLAEHPRVRIALDATNRRVVSGEYQKTITLRQPDAFGRMPWGNR